MLGRCAVSSAINSIDLTVNMEGNNKTELVSDAALLNRLNTAVDESSSFRKLNVTDIIYEIFPQMASLPSRLS